MAAGAVRWRATRIHAHRLLAPTRDRQSILADYLLSDGISTDRAIDLLAALLDGPRTRAADAAVEREQAAR
jgi:hypothetical protein